MSDPVQQAMPSRRSRGKLLLVDDNELNRQRLGYRLESVGYAVAFAESGRECIDKLREEQFDLVLLDTMMPELSGHEVLMVLKDDPALHDVPVIMVSGLDDVESVARCIEFGAEDYLSSPFDPVLLSARIDSCLESRRLREQEATFLRQLQKEKDHSERLVNVVIPIGITLMSERNVNRLLEQILSEAKKLSNADGGTLYLCIDSKQLKFVVLLNDSLKTAMGGTTGKPIPFPPLNLYHPETGQPNHNQIACHVALTGKSVNIADAYHAEGFDFHGTKAFDQKTGYRSTSFLTVPLKDSQGVVIGVLQLINAIDPQTKKVVPFDHALQQSIESLSLLAAAALQGLKSDQPQ
jgi:CheY-like chemotaxis protein